MGLFTFFKLYIWYQMAQRTTFAKDNSSIETIATSVVANEVEKMEIKDVCKYSLKRSEKQKLYQQKHQLNLAVKVKLLLFLTYYFKG